VKTEDHAVAAGHSVDPAGWQEAFESLMGRIVGRFARVEPRRRVRKLVLGPKWDADQIRDDLREYVVEHLHDDQAVDEMGDVKKGTRTAGVQRQYTGTAGRIENSQVAVYLVYAGRHGHAAADRELYVPRSWTAGPSRWRDAGLDEDIAFATNPNWPPE
jgi:SRSO17 transposase